MLIRGLVGAMAVLAMAVTSASASAATYCVPAHAGCAGTPEPTLAAAITAANASSSADDILLAAGTFTGGAQVNYETHIAGAGQGATVIDGGSAAWGVFLGHSSSSIRDLTIHEPSGGPSIGLYLAGTAERVTVDLRDNPVDASTAVSLHDDGSFTDGAALASLASPHADYGIAISGAGDALVSGVQAQGRYAATTDGAGFKTLRFMRLSGDIKGLNASADSTLLDDSTVTGAPVVGYLFGGAGDIVTTLRHVTLNGTYAGAESDDHTSKLVLSNTAIVGGGGDPETPDIELARLNTGTARVEVDYSFYRADHAIFTPGTGIEFAPGAHNVDGADAKLLDLTHGDLRPRFDSPLIDAGDPVPGGGEPMADLGGEFRAVNGRTDIGAYEYGRHTPTITATVDKTSAETGETVTFGASVADLDPNELPGVTWTFDDGTPPVSGLVVTHSFTTLGSHTATATATDPAGLTATGHASVAVTTPLLPRAALAPAFAFKKLRARRGVVGVRLSCPAVAADCAGRVELRLARKPKAKGLAARTIVLGRAKYAIANGTSRTVRVKLTRSARKRLRRARHGLNVKVVARPAGAASKSKTVRLTGR